MTTRTCNQMKFMTNVISEHFPKGLIKTGVKLPRSSKEWEEVNSYFKANIDFSTDITDINQTVNALQSNMYEYFKDNYGLSKSELSSTYDHLSKNQLKKSLRQIKSSVNPNIEEVKYISRLLRRRFKNDGQNADGYDHNAKISRNFWSYCKNIFENKERVKPEFSEKECFEYFSNVVKEKGKTKKFDFPSWMKPLENPTHDFNLEAPTYQEVTNIVRKIKSSGSPCPLDQISIIAFKKCPVLRTQLWRILQHCWSNKSLPSCWRNAITILAYKKVNMSDPSNFRPITLEPVLLKVFNLVIRNRLYQFVSTNKFIETNIQKGFWSDISGTIEHTETLTYLLNHWKLKQRNLVVTLIDLKNAFGEVNHNLLRSSLTYHHVPDHIIELIMGVYDDFTISIATDEFLTHPIKMKRGVLQGDSLSPLLFNLCINTLITTIKDEKLNCFGYVYDNCSIPRNWFQFADDTAIVTGSVEDNQLLLNTFTKWCTWADLIIRVDKCHTFSMKKSSSKSSQFNPYVKIKGQIVAPIEQGKSFIYLGKEFNFGMNCSNIKTEIETKFLDYLTKIDILPLHPKNKLQIVQRYVFFKT